MMLNGLFEILLDVHIKAYLPKCYFTLPIKKKIMTEPFFLQEQNVMLHLQSALQQIDEEFTMFCSRKCVFLINVT